MTKPPFASQPATKLLTRRLSLQCLALLACTPFSTAGGVSPTVATAADDLGRAHAALAGDDALALGRQIAGLLGRDAARALLEAESSRFSNALREDAARGARRTLHRLAAEDFRANRVLELRGLWLARVEVALLIAPIARDRVVSAG